jgi:squalene-associated FAD-dependent desaturase
MSASHYDVIIAGAGLAGLAAASALSGAGAKVLLLERKPFVGGRAYSYLHPSLQEEIDCQHVLLGCCTNLRALCADADIADLIRWYKGFTFLEPGKAEATTLQPGLLPAPFHSSIDFLRAPMLSLADKAGVARGLLEFVHGYPSSDTESFATWAKRTRQTERAIRHLWQPIVVSALNDTFENCSTKYAGQVFHESFIKSAEGGWFGFPTEPLSTFYAHVAEQCARQGTELRLGQSVAGLSHNDASDAWTVQTSVGNFAAGNVILALPFQGVAELLPTDAPGCVYRERFSHFQHAPITTVHLWFDREITDLDHAVLLDTGIQWLFHKSRIRRWNRERGSYIELTISDSSAQLRQSREQILETALRELEMFFPAIREAKLLKSGILKEARATFSVTPGLDAHRPAQTSPWPGLFVAGDWTATEWPSTMEGAVRSGYMAAGAALGQSFLVPDLPSTGLMRLLAR